PAAPRSAAGPAPVHLAAFASPARDDVPARRACPATGVIVRNEVRGPITHGVTSTSMRVVTRHGVIPVHVVDADLASPGVRVRQLGDAVTHARPVLAAAHAQKHVVAAVNGDLFHTTPDGVTTAPGGVMSSSHQPLKGWATSQLVVSVEHGRAHIGWAHLRGVLFALHVPAGVAAPQLPKPSRTLTQGRQWTHVRHGATHAKPVHLGPKNVPPPATRAPAGPTTATGTSGLRASIVPLTALNDDLATGAVVYTPAWGPGDRRAGWHIGSREIDVHGTKVVQVRKKPGQNAPRPGNAAVVVDGAYSRALSWVRPGDRVAMSVQLVHDDTGLPLGTAISGNSKLLTDGRVEDFACVLDDAGGPRPRVMAGTYDGGRHLVLVVADGDRPGQRGLTLREEAELARTLRLDDALNLDGGDSSALVERVNGHLVQVNDTGTSARRAVPDGLAITRD
ncbi:MAG TPA: phosphodiester glycosidase family protein, partial [Mycobacteriales bacterium]|nr:phosphodiester glycosidase family protein [Mycobacteriales bacterium]